METVAGPEVEVVTRVREVLLIDGERFDDDPAGVFTKQHQMKTEALFVEYAADREQTEQYE
jgi:hypothetical protein